MSNEFLALLISAPCPAKLIGENLKEFNRRLENLGIVELYQMVNHD